MPSSSQLTALLKRILLPSSPWKLPIKNRLGVGIRSFSSLPSSSASQKRWSYFSEDDSETETSLVYNHALKFQRPSTIIYGEHSVNNRPLNLQRPVPSVYKKQPTNSVSLIGTILYQAKRMKTHDRFGVCTLLKVKTSPQSTNTFRILLKMWEEMAEMAMHHLKPNDFVYVSGNLRSYVKADRNGDPRIWYEVIVRELNYVAQHGEKPIIQQGQKLDLQASGEDYSERQRNRLHLWQVFFANPCEWMDFRKSKPNHKHPDFKHVSTGEALWLNPDDPPWIRKQLQFVDSVSAGCSPGDSSSTSFRPLLTNDVTE
ncbi:protein OSB1, mitochondrial [Coffea eugenioides]|uniref:protein OSB1, mitochondrial n=1 Tax=Coffea eugenioides TaxID=49369 RepID=UPI000F60D333|nr:protein OSB1, mitochondrial [Coffea eugenioides]